MSWNALEEFITNITTSLYNGAYIRQYNVTKALVSNAFRENAVQYKKLEGITTKELAEQFVETARTMFLNFQSPSSNFNAWNKVGGYGRAIITWSNPQDIVFLIRNDIQSKLDVQVLAKAFNVDSASLLGRIVPVDNFDIYDKKYNKIYDGSHIIGIMADKSWFRIKSQDMYMEDFRNPNNRSLQYYLNVIKMYSYSYFANAVVFTTEDPKINITELKFNESDVTLSKVGDETTLTVTSTPVNATIPEVTFEKTNEYVEVTKIDNRSCKVKALSSGIDTVKAKAGNVETSIQVVVS